MTDTPHLDAAFRAGCPWYTCEVPNCQPECENYKISALEILRAALPWEPSADAVEAMAYARTMPYLPIKSEYADAVRIYRAQPIMRELYPEKF